MSFCQNAHRAIFQLSGNLLQTLNFTLSNDDAVNTAIGLIVLQTDETMEHDLRHGLPASYRLFHTRIPNDQHVDESTLQQMRKRLPEVAAMLPEHTRFRVIVYGCTSGSTVIGEQVVTDSIQRIFPGSAVTNPLSAIKAQLHNVEARRIALLTPYEPDVSAALIRNIENEGFRIVSAGTFNETQDHRVARISRQSLLDAIYSLAANVEIDALVASCTNLRMFDIIKEASEKIGCPVISSNSALAWHIQHIASADS